MTIQKMKTTTFKKSTVDQWKEAATQSLRGKPLESLVTKTIEGIDLKPLYTLEDYEKRLHKKRSIKKDASWIIAQQTFGEDGKDFLDRLRTSISRGNEAIVYDGTKQLVWDEVSQQELANLMKDYPVYLTNTKLDDPILNVFELVAPEERAAVTGAVSVKGWALPNGYANVKSVGADMWHAHHDGADAVTELALALAIGAEQATNATDFADFAAEFFVHFAVDTHFFMEIAKFRAFRICWQAFCSAYDVTEAPYIPVLATTSLRSYSKLDPYVNVLRAGNETLAAVLGGADMITVHPHTILTGPTDSSIRIARNIQLVIKEETHIDKVIDPAGGTYFIETLTSELVEHAWVLFLEIEASGGYQAFDESGRLATLLEERKAEVATGKKSLIGTNVYAELTDTTLTDWDGIQAVERLAGPFERLRTQFADEEIRTVLLTFGDLKDFKPRADFVSGFLATGGLQSEWSPAFKNAEEANEWLAAELPDYAIVCATPAMTETVMEQLLAGAPEKMIVDVAGKYDAALEEKWLQAGLDGFIYAGQNKVDKLQRIFSLWNGGRVTDEQA
ncbi:methylmalonyl-CoA mutase family protein [Filibacter tadaridae]|uniref:Methylmalonyl-CoA mutase n=1 Tax=Filibacter tadaridae TaxID=2483811 RepID=A0A3P5XW55_9BACL|nr:methylmalonyl-CoA mutase family protein [Filibacter tadaridae]VDC32372.1 Methylmalonyl-CoA mutase [Filibacter tadaridae]